jgi:molecular chaperone IbpA|tara:strand:+ start:1156 stop:1602 length:447 start_codon:yes stop_codon:yes gene_type:complete
MVSKAFSFPHSNFIGFDHLWQEIEKLSVSGDNTFPKHNVVKYSDNEYSIQLALAGYSEKDIDVEVKEGILVVRGGKPNDTGEEYLHKGISTKKFTRTFRLSEHVVVDGAEFIDGLLVIHLKVEIPEEKRSRNIPIGTRSTLLPESTTN